MLDTGGKWHERILVVYDPVEFRTAEAQRSLRERRD